MDLAKFYVTLVDKKKTKKNVPGARDEMHLEPCHPPSSSPHALPIPLVVAVVAITMEEVVAVVCCDMAVGGLGHGCSL